MLEASKEKKNYIFQWTRGNFRLLGPFQNENETDVWLRYYDTQNNHIKSIVIGLTDEQASTPLEIVTPEDVKTKRKRSGGIERDELGVYIIAVCSDSKPWLIGPFDIVTSANKMICIRQYLYDGVWTFNKIVLFTKKLDKPIEIIRSADIYRTRSSEHKTQHPWQPPAMDSVWFPD